MLKKYIGLANKILALFYVAEIELTQHNYYRYKKIDVLVALVKKMFFTFKAMVEDAQREYPESHHHLKTLIESFIYYCFVARDETDTNAKLIIAEVAYNKKKYIDSNPDTKKKETYYKELNDALDANTLGIEEEWEQYKSKSLEQIAKKLRLFDIYNRYYRFACEPAHITDILDFFPSETAQFALQRNLPEEHWSIISLQYSMNLMIQIIKDVSDYFKLNLEEKIKYIKDDLDSLMKLSETMEIEKDISL